MSFSCSRISSRLFSAYEEILKHNPGPDCAVHKKHDQQQLVRPAIPFVGDKYAEQKPRILVYASAETLSDYYPGSKSDRPWLEHDDFATERHRVRFADSKTDNNFFPDVHIQPMYDGTLATAVLYIASKFTDISNLTPRDFCERIAFANYSKYTLETERQRNIRLHGINEGSDKNKDPSQMSNREYREFMHVSHLLIEADVGILRPDIIILPKKLRDRDCAFWENIEEKQAVKTIGIYQLGPIPINCVISPDPKYPAKDPNALDQTVKLWLEHIRRVSKDNYLHVFSYLDDIINSQK